MIKVFGVGIGIALVIALAIFTPFLYIWAFNTLFPSFNIPYTFDTWAATLLLGGFFTGSIVKASKKD